jgi:hypothetical protein
VAARLFAFGAVAEGTVPVRFIAVYPGAVGIPLSEKAP